MKIDKEKYKKDRTVCKSCYNGKKRKNNKSSLIQNEITASHQQSKIDNVKINRTFIIGFPNCGKNYLTTYILLRKQDPIFINTKPLNQYPNIKAQISDEIQQLEKIENNAVVFDDILLSKQASNIDVFSTRGRHQKIDIYYIS